MMKTKEIGEQLAAEALKYPEKKGYNGSSVATFEIDGLRIRCPAYQERIASVAAKYIKGFRWKTQRLLLKPTLRRPPNADELLASLEDANSDLIG
jgi:hypothetical protein